SRPAGTFIATAELAGTLRGVLPRGPGVEITDPGRRQSDEVDEVSERYSGAGGGRIRHRSRPDGVGGRRCPGQDQECRSERTDGHARQWNQADNPADVDSRRKVGAQAGCKREGQTRSTRW